MRSFRVNMTSGPPRSHIQKKMEIDVYAAAKGSRPWKPRRPANFAAAEKHWTTSSSRPDYEHFTSSKYFMLLHQKKAPDEAGRLFLRGERPNSIG